MPATLVLFRPTLNTYGPPDLEPALLVRPELRFATGHLAGELGRLGEGFHRFEHWSEVARRLVGGDVA